MTSKIERRRIYSAGAKPALNSRVSGAMRGEASGEQAPLKEGGSWACSLLGASTRGHPECEQKALSEGETTFPTPVND
jgi:hypothetical protein